MPKNSSWVLNELKNPFFALAPMDDVTDTVFRQIVAECSPPDLFFTEFVNVDGLQSPGRQQLLRKLQFSSKERPIIAQIWGKQPENFKKTAQELVSMGFAGIDINMGCPVKAVIKNGCCAALINNPDKALQIIKAVKEGARSRVPISVKTRLGFDEIDMSWPKLLLEQDLDMLAIHGRTVKQLSKVPANWEAINEVRKIRDQISPKTKIVGNGDVTSKQQGLSLAKRYKLDGIMIGRGIFSDPFVFSDFSHWTELDREKRIRLFADHVRLFINTWPEKTVSAHILNKFCKIYIQDFDGAKDLRERCMQTGSTNRLLKVLETAL